MINLEKVRSDVPACRDTLHLHHSGASLPPSCVVDAVIEHVKLEATIGGYEAVVRRLPERDNVYAAIGKYLGANKEQIALTESATVAWTRAFGAICRQLRAGDKILTGRSEYASNYIAFLQAEQQFGIKIEVIEDDVAGQADCARLANMIDEHVKLVAITHVPTNGGLINPARQIGELCRQAGITYLLDACQSVGQMPIDVIEIGCDFLCATGRKFLRGPRGSGFLYASQRALDEYEPFPLDLHSATWIANSQYDACATARRFEYFESNVAAQLGLGVAVEYAMAIGQDAIWERIQTLSAYLRDGLSQVPGVELRDKGDRQSGIVSFTCAGLDPDRVQGLLRSRGINCGTSHVESTRLDMEERGQSAFFRPSVHYFNTESELDRFIAEIRSLSPSCVEFG